MLSREQRNVGLGHDGKALSNWMKWVKQLFQDLVTALKTEAHI